MQITDQQCADLGVMLIDARTSGSSCEAVGRLAVAECGKLLLTPCTEDEAQLYERTDGSVEESISVIFSDRLAAVTPKRVDPRVLTITNAIESHRSGNTAKLAEAICAALDGGA